MQWIQYHSDSDMHKDMEYFIHSSVVSTLLISNVKLKELRDLNSNDPTMQMLQYSLQGCLLISVMYTHL